SMRTNPTFTKSQGIAISDDLIILSFGRSTQSNNVSKPHLQQGLLVLDTEGNIVKRGMMDNEKLFNKYIELGYDPNKVENEGVWVDKDNNVYTLNVLRTTSPTHGLLIIKEGSTDVNALDFKDVAAPIFS